MGERKRDAERSRGEILDAAEVVFAERGYDGATISEICEQAGVSRGLPSYLFGSKDGLYRAVVERAANDLRRSVIEPLRQAPSRLSLELLIEQGVSTYLEYLARNPRIVRLLQWEMLAPESDNRPFAPSTELFEELLDVLAPAFERKGRTRTEAQMTLAGLVSLCFFPFMGNFAKRVFGPTMSKRAGIAERTKAVMQLLRQGVLR